MDENRTSVTQASGDRSVSSTLTINMAMLNDSGEYVCNASSPNYDTVSSDSATVVVIGKVNSTCTLFLPVLIVYILCSHSVPPSNVVIALNTSIAMRNDSVTFTCDAQGGPSNLYQWQRNGENLDEMTQPILQLTSVDASDGGEYTCVVSNAAGNDSNFLTLYIQPYIVTHPQQILATVPESVSFTCEALGFPAPSYRWDKIGDPEFQRFTQNLTFNSVNFGNEGLYQCVASIMVDMINYTAESNQGELICEFYVTVCEAYEVL